MAVSWTSNKIQTSIGRDLYKDCQVDEFGGWPDGVVPIKTSEDAEKEKITKNCKQPPILFPAQSYDMLVLDRTNKEEYFHLISWFMV